MIILNLKNYLGAKEVFKFVNKFRLEKLIVCSPMLNLKELSRGSSLEIFSQGVSSFEIGNSTGHLLAKQLKEIGVGGSLINHSENRLNFNEIKKIVFLLNKFKLKSLVCVQSLSEVKKIMKLDPWGIAYEDKNLIGTDKSILKYRQKEVGKFGFLLKGSRIKAFCGAGVNSQEDYCLAKCLDCFGVLISSSIVNSDNPLKKYKEIKND